MLRTDRTNPERDRLKVKSQGIAVMNVAPKFGPAFTLESADAANLDPLERQAEACTRCDLYKNATQLVFGEGSQKADIMLVGEQPGDKEDIAGHPLSARPDACSTSVSRRLGSSARDATSPLRSSTSSSRLAASAACIRSPTRGRSSAAPGGSGLKSTSRSRVSSSRSVRPHFILSLAQR